MSKPRIFSLQPAGPSSASPQSVDRNLGRVATILHVIAHTLATTEGLMAERWARELRAQTFDLRHRLAEVMGEPALGSAPLIASPHSSMRQRAPRRRTLNERTPHTTEIDEAILETLVEGIDVPRLTDSLWTLAQREPERREEVLCQVAPLLDTVSSLFDLVASRGEPLEIAAERVRLPELLEQITRSSWRAARYRRATLIVTTESPSVQADRDLLRRLITMLLDQALVAMPPESTIDLAVHGGRAAELEMSFTGCFRPTDPRSMMAGRELDFVRLAIAAHGGALALDERGGRTNAYFALPRREEVVIPFRRAA